MKRLLTLTILMASAPLIGMEKDQQNFPWDKLLPELKNEVLKQVVNAPTVVQAIKNLQNLRFVNKDLYNTFTTNKTVLYNVLNTLAQYFPGSEVLIARTLNTQLAQEWLKSVNPNASIKIIPTDSTAFLRAAKYIRDGDLDSLKKWLDQGYDPKHREHNGWTLATYLMELSPSVSGLELINKYDPNLFSLENIKELLFALLSTAKRNPQRSAQEKQNVLDTRNYLIEKLQQYMSAEEAQQKVENLENGLPQFRW